MGLREIEFEPADVVCFSKTLASIDESTRCLNLEERHHYEFYFADLVTKILKSFEPPQINLILEIKLPLSDCVVFASGGH